MHLKTYLSGLQLDPGDIASLDRLRPRDGFMFVREEELGHILAYFSADPRLSQLFPILTDGQNCICIYTTGPLKGFICEWNHEETDITPRFSNITNLVNAVNLYIECWEMRAFPDEGFDYPSRNRLRSTEKEKQIIEQLKRDFETEENEDMRIQWAFCIMALTPLEELEQLYPLLDHDDMYIQERAILIVGFYRPPAVKEKIISLVTAAKHNGRIAAQYVLRNWESSDNAPFIW